MALAQRAWQRRASAQHPVNFDGVDGILTLHACTLKSGAASTTLRCSIGGAAPFALARLTESSPSCSLRVRLEDSAVLTCESDALITGVLLPAVASRRRQRREDDEVRELEECALQMPVSKAAKRGSAESTSAATSSSTGLALTASLPSNSAATATRAAPDKATKPLVPLSHRVLKSGLEYQVLKSGRGAVADRAKQVHVRFEGRLAASGYCFDSGVIKFRLGLGEVIRGWDEGIQGMLVGECRRLFVPARLGYGHAGAPPEIPPQAALVFEVELLGV